MDKKEILSKVEHTLLSPTATWEQVRAICDEGKEFEVATVCIPPRFVKRANSYVGIGVTVDSVSREEGLLVQSVTRDGPADKAGVLAGDVITAVDGASIAGEGRETASDLIRGEEGTKVALTLLGEDGASRDVTCTRATLHNASAQGRLLDNKVGYVQLSNFYSGSADSFQAEVDALLEQGAESLLIDLRGDPGGYVSELEQILDYLLPEGPVFTHKPRWWFKSVYVSDENCVDLPMAVLVNQHSYSAAELLAEQGTGAEVVKLHRVAPLDVEPVAESVRRTGRLLVLEDCNENGSIGQQLASALVQSGAAPRKMVLKNLKTAFAPQGTVAQLRKLLGLDAGSVAEAVREML